MSWIANESALEESYVEFGRVVIDKLKDEHFECEAIIKLCLGSVHFCNLEQKQKMTFIHEGIFDS